MNENERADDAPEPLPHKNALILEENRKQRTAKSVFDYIRDRHATTVKEVGVIGTAFAFIIAGLVSFVICFVLVWGVVVGFLNSVTPLGMAAIGVFVLVVGAAYSLLNPANYTGFRAAASNAENGNKRLV